MFLVAKSDPFTFLILSGEKDENGMLKLNKVAYNSTQKLSVSVAKRV